MSLLIKALDKAESEKAQADKAKKPQAKRSPKALKTDFGSTGKFENLSLAEPNAHLLHGAVESASASTVPSAALAENPPVQKSQKPAYDKADKTSAPVTLTNAIPSAHPESAAKVFAAKRIEPSHQNTKLAALAGVALLTLLAMGWYVYQLVNVPEPVMPVRPLPPPVAQVPTSTVPEAQLPAQSPALPSAAETQVFAEKDSAKPAVAVVTDGFSSRPLADKKAIVAPDQVAMSEKPQKNGSGELAVSAVASPSVSVSISRNKPETGVNPTLMRAYEAYSAGRESEAQTLYKQVLQQDIRNVDALLGLAAIASHQGREADALGWYRKVLEVEPRNVIAQSAMLEMQENIGEASSESSLKAMLEKSPEDADLYTKLGHQYADKSQWAAAQQAYFEAYRLKPNADNAFNLAVGLDQLRKPKLALPYYQQALELMNSSSGIDRSALEARIQAIQ